MSKSRHTQTVLVLPQGWEWELAAVVDRYAADLGVGKGALAKALGFGSDLSPSTLSGPHREARYCRLCACLVPANIPLVAAALRLEPGKYNLLEGFFRAAVKVVQGWDVDPAASRGARRETIDWGYVGVELYDRGHWDEAAIYLERAWQALRAPGASRDPIALHTMLRVGTQLISLDSHIGQTIRTQRIINELAGISRQVLGARHSTHELLKACAHYLTATGVAYRLSDSLPERSVVAYSQSAFNVLSDSAIDLSGQVAALRDQAKPLIRLALRAASQHEAQSATEDAWDALERSEALAGGRVPPEELRAAWLFTRLQRIECFAVAGRTDEAAELLNEVVDSEWIIDLLADRQQTPIISKVAFTRIVVASAQERYDDAERLAQDFLIDPKNFRYQSRLSRVRSIHALMTEPELKMRLEAVLL